MVVAGTKTCNQSNKYSCNQSLKSKCKNKKGQGCGTIHMESVHIRYLVH